MLDLVFKIVSSEIVVKSNTRIIDWFLKSGVFLVKEFRVYLDGRVSYKIYKI
jgi:hypothetical protein